MRRFPASEPPRRDGSDAAATTERMGQLRNHDDTTTPSDSDGSSSSDAQQPLKRPRVNWVSDVAIANTDAPVFLEDMNERINGNRSVKKPVNIEKRSFDREVLYEPPADFDSASSSFPSHVSDDESDSPQEVRNISTVAHEDDGDVVYDFLLGMNKRNQDVLSGPVSVLSSSVDASFGRGDRREAVMADTSASHRQALHKMRESNASQRVTPPLQHHHNRSAATSGLRPPISETYESVSTEELVNEGLRTLAKATWGDSEYDETAGLTIYELGFQLDPTAPVIFPPLTRSIRGVPLENPENQQVRSSPPPQILPIGIAALSIRSQDAAQEVDENIFASPSVALSSNGASAAPPTGVESAEEEFSSVKFVLRKILAAEFSERCSQRSITVFQNVVQAMCSTPLAVVRVMEVLEEHFALALEGRNQSLLLVYWYIIDCLLKYYRAEREMLSAVLLALPHLLNEYVPWLDQDLARQPWMDALKDWDRYEAMFSTWKEILPDEMYVELLMRQGIDYISDEEYGL